MHLPTPVRQVNRLKRRGFSDPNLTLFPRASIQQSAPEKPFQHGRSSQLLCSLSSLQAGGLGRVFSPHSCLIELQTQGFLPPAFMVPVRAGLATYNGGEKAVGSPNPSLEERICLIPHLLRGVGFPIHPFLRRLLGFYDLQLHNFTPASVLHIAGYVALCELFLGCEADTSPTYL